MDLLFIMRDALGSSAIGTLVARCVEGDAAIFGRDHAVPLPRQDGA